LAPGAPGILASECTPPATTGTLFADYRKERLRPHGSKNLYNREISVGCQASPLLDCPSTPVTRSQMAVFLTRTFGL
jgi:hypothetical protein